MTVPNQFSSLVGTIPLLKLDQNFSYLYDLIEQLSVGANSPYVFLQPNGTDDTENLTNAIIEANAAETFVLLDKGTFIISNSILEFGANIKGVEKETTIIKWKSGSSASSMLKFSGSVYSVKLSNLTIDGNFQNQTDTTGYYGAVELSGSDGSSLICSDVNFINGRIHDILVVGKGGSENKKLFMSNCYFYNGLVGTSTRAASSVVASDNVDVFCFSCEFTQPTKPVAYGRAGVLMQRPNASTYTTFGSYFAAFNNFKNYGRGTSDTLGCLDVYSGASSVFIFGNYAEDCVGRCFDAKSDSSMITISNNKVFRYDGLSASLPAIALYNQATSYAAGDIAKVCLISQNQIFENERNDNYAIVIDGRDGGGVQNFENVICSENIIQGKQASAGKSGILVRYVSGISISSNNIFGDWSSGVSFNDIEGSISFCGGIIDGPQDGISGISGISLCDISIKLVDFKNQSSNSISLAACKSFNITQNSIYNSFIAYSLNGSTDPSYLGKNSVIGSTNLLDLSGSNPKMIYEPDITDLSVGFSQRTLTISSGDVSIFATWHYIDTEGGAATDELNTVYGGIEGMTLTFFAANNGRDVVLKDAVGNLQLSGDFTLTHTTDSITLFKRGSSWIELSRSDNTA